MKFENVKQLAREFEKLSGNKWEINLKTIMPEINSRYVFEDTHISDYGDLPQDQPLTLEDLRLFFKLSGKDMKFLTLQQSIMFFETDEDGRDWKFSLVRRFPLSTKLDDGSTIAENLEDFSWTYHWTDGGIDGFHYIPSNGNVHMEGTPNEKVLNFISNQKISIRDCRPVTHHAEEAQRIWNICEKALENMEKQNTTGGDGKGGKQ